ncbi:MAG: CoA pyrophosphatase [Anaerolineae bacterium]|jgi:8-oxo-dGTP pyrophosphatase MutT (NUDIX family)|nr:CoA pyrophosphatase [Anaerolineae bacterium]
MYLTPEHVRAALAGPPLDDAAAMSPLPRGFPPPALADTPPRQAAVLVLLYPARPDDWQIILTRRTETLKKHSGQISFPGGSRDDDDASWAATALRETCEELGLCHLPGLALLGELATCYIPPTHYEVHPVVAAVPVDVQPLLKPSGSEVAQVLALALDDLLRPATRQEELRQIMGYSVVVPYYRVQEHKVWGATAVILGDLEARLRHTLPPDVLHRL